MSTPALAASPFDGRWRPDTSTLQSDAKPRAILLKHGMFRDDDDYPVVVPADGALHSVRGGHYIDQTSITVVDQFHVQEVDRIHGKTVYAVTYVVSANRKLLDLFVTSFANPAGKPVYSKARYRRIGPIPASAHIISGNWQQVKLTVGESSDWLLKLDGNRFSFWSLQGSGYAAVVGGPRVRIKGDQSGAFAAITMPRPNIVVEADSSPDGRVGGILTMTLLPDRRSIRAVALTPRTGKTSTFLLRKH